MRDEKRQQQQGKETVVQAAAPKSMPVPQHLLGTEDRAEGVEHDTLSQSERVATEAMPFVEREHVQVTTPSKNMKERVVCTWAEAFTPFF